MIYTSCMPEMDDETYVVLDGGRGWVVVAGVALINMTNQSILSIFGLLFGTKLTQIQQGTFTAALITNLNSLALNFSGIFIGPIMKSCKARNIASIGCLMVSTGLVICAFGSQVWHFIVGYSFFIGIGLGLIGPSTFMAINSYFNTKRGIAVGVSLAGVGVGQVILPQIVRIFLDNYGFRAAVLAMALVSFSGIFGAMLLRPFSLNTPCNLSVKSLDLELLLDPIFVSIILGLGLVYTSTVNFTMLFPMFLQTSVGLSSTTTATCMSIAAGADILNRLILPSITDKLQVPYRVIFLLGTVGLLISRAALAESTDLTSIIAMSIFTGMTKSATVLNNNLTISGHCHADKLAGGLGLNMIAKGVFVITIGQLLGWIRDYTGSYVVALHAQNVPLLLVVLIWTLELYYQRRHQRRTEYIKLTNGKEIIKSNGFNDANLRSNGTVK